MEFFRFDYYCNTNFSVYEIVVPLILIAVIICLSVVFRSGLNNTMLGKKIKRIVFFLFAATFISDYIFTYSQYGIQMNSLPLELCSFSAMLSMLSLIHENDKIIFFLEAVSLPAALMAIVSPATGGDCMHLQYYLFMINHGLTIIIPAYYILVEHKLAKVKNIFESIGILLCISVIICIFNTIFDTSYFFLSLTKNPYSFGIIGALGEAPFYIIKLVILGIAILLIWGALLLMTGRIIMKHENRRVQTIEG